MEETKIPDEIIIKAEKATEKLLPQKSKVLYNKEYEKFQYWMTENNVDQINETVLLGYFGDLAQSFSPNSLWAKYSMLKKTLLVNKNVNVKNYYKLGEFLKQGSKGYEPKKSKVLSRELVLQFIHNAPDETFLMVKVALIFGVFGGCRRQELVNMLINHVEDRGSVFVINIPETKTDKKRVFTIIDENQMNSIMLVRKYISLRPHGCSEKRFFLGYRHGRCFGQPVGKNTFGKIPSHIAKYLGLSDADKFTGHCLRRTSATLLAEAGASMTTLKRHGGWKSSSVAEGYLEDSISSKNKVSRMLAGVPSTYHDLLPTSAISVNEGDKLITNTASTFTAANVTITGSFQNCHFNIK